MSLSNEILGYDLREKMESIPLTILISKIINILRFI